MEKDRSWTEVGGAEETKGGRSSWWKAGGGAVEAEHHGWGGGKGVFKVLEFRVLFQDLMFSCS